MNDDYFRALRDRDIRAFERLYSGGGERRKKSITDAVAESIRALLHTGLGSDNNFRAFWAPSRRWQQTLAKFLTRGYEWVGLL